MSAQILAIVFPVFALVAVGFFYARRRPTDMRVANGLNISVFTPALIVSILAGKDFQLAAYQDLMLAAAVVVLLSGLLAWPVARAAGWQIRTFVPPMMFNNSGNMGLPLALFAFGEAALPAAVVMFLVENLLHFTVGNAMMEGRVHPLVLLRMPMLLATIVGVGLSLGQVPIWPPLMEAIDLLGQIAIPLMLFSLGVRMTGIDLSDWRMGLAGALICPATGLLAAFGAAELLDIGGRQWQQLMLFGALPPAVLNFMVAERFDQQPRQVAAVVLFGNAASLLVIPVVLAWVL
jgi:predicted permease